VIDLEAILAQHEPLIRRNFLIMVREMRGSVDEALLVQLIESGRTNEALAIVLQSAGNIATASTAAFIAAAQGTAVQIGTTLGTIAIDYNITNSSAVLAMQQNQLALVQGFTQSQVAATQEAIVSGIRDGLNPRQQARRFKDSIGLTRKQQQAVDSYERNLRNASGDALNNKLRNRANDAAVRRAAATGEALSAARIERMVEQYRLRMIAHRATVIARTEALRSVHEGSESMLDQAIADGTLQADEIVRHWFTAKDERVRGTHRTMHKQKRGVGVPFTSGAGISLMRPGDSRAPASETIQCRCRVATTIKILSTAGSAA
jgi:hypothetical protein